VLVKKISRINLHWNPRRCRRHSVEFKHKIRIEEQLTERYSLRTCYQHLEVKCRHR
jgi:hypothetical protein